MGVRGMAAWTSVTLMDLQGRMPPGRVAWADLAKAVSILLLVAWTTLGDSIYLNEMLLFLRMPLFFFVSGLFAYKMITRTDFGTFLRDRIGNLLYLYALWATMLFLARDVALHLVQGRPLDIGRQVAIFWNPELNLWFLYALAIAFVLARLLRDVPVWIVLVASVAIYLVLVSSGNWRHMPFLERLARLFPFFWIGLTASPLVTHLVERHHRLWPLFLALFFALAWLVYGSPLRAVGPLTFAISLIGIGGLLMLTRQLSDFSWTWPLSAIGASTLAIYVMHKIVLFYADYAMGLVGIDIPGFDALKVIPVVIFCVVFGRWALGRSWAAWLFQAPWVVRAAKSPRLAAA